MAKDNTARLTVTRDDGLVRISYSVRPRVRQSTAPRHVGIAFPEHDSRNVREVVNIVSPTSFISQEPAPFTLLGNRGVLHEGQRLKHHARGDRWIYCVTSALEDPNALMFPGTVTELFFLDEPTALAAEHRPCDKCNRTRFREFKEAWEVVHELKEVRAHDIDAKLGVSRDNKEVQVTFRANASDLPAGVMIREPGRIQPLLVFQYQHPKGHEHRCAYPWTSHGYGVKESLPLGEVEVLTPKPIVEMIRAGFDLRLERPLLFWGSTTTQPDEMQAASTQ